MKNNLDVIVAGLGPAGSTAAYYLARSGFSVLALDKAKFPRIKPCGGGITGKGLKATDIDWSSCVEYRAHSVKLVCRNQSPLEFKSNSPLIYMVSRPVFDKFLADKALEKGAVIHMNEKIKQVIQEESHVTVITEKNTYRANYLIGADGALGIIRRLIFGQEPDENLYVAVESESCPIDIKSKSSNEEIYFELGSAPTGYGWVFDKKYYQSVGVYGPVKKMKFPVRWYHQFVQESARQLQNNRVTVRSYPVPIYSLNHSTIAKGRIILVGDAAKLVDPLLGEGIYYAMYSGRIAAESLIECYTDPVRMVEIYQNRIEKEISRELRIARKLAQFIYGIPSLSFRVFGSYPESFELFCKVLGGSMTYSDFVQQLKSNLFNQRPLLSRILFGSQRIRVLLSTGRN